MPLAGRVVDTPFDAGSFARFDAPQFAQNVLDAGILEDAAGLDAMGLDYQDAAILGGLKKAVKSASKAVSSAAKTVGKAASTVAKTAANTVVTTAKSAV